MHNYSRFISKSDNQTIGTHSIQTSGNTILSGDAIDVQNFYHHSYQVNPTSGTISGDFYIEVSNDGAFWNRLTGFSFVNSGGAEILYSDDWHYKYARTRISGSGYYVINESHLA